MKMREEKLFLFIKPSIFSLFPRSMYMLSIAFVSNCNLLPNICRRHYLVHLIHDNNQNMNIREKLYVL